MSSRLRAIKGISGVRESFILSTCNRVEAYAVIDADVSPSAVMAAMIETLDASERLSPSELASAIVTATEDEVVRHVLAVTCGLESMVVGEYQIVAQVRDALRAANEAGTLGPVLGCLINTALRTSKRARTETAVSGTGRSMVSVGVERAAQHLGGLTARSALIIGAGRMGTLTGPLLREAGIGSVAVVSRTEAHAIALATKVRGVAVGMPNLTDTVATVDLIVSSTGAPGHILEARQVTDAMRQRPDRPLFIIDLGLPRDVDPLARDIPNVTVFDIEDIGAYLRERNEPDDVAAAWKLVDEAVAEFRRWREQSQLAPVIGALRAVASELVESEVRRLHNRLPQLDSRSQQETGAAVRRAVGKLLHTPTVRVRELATGPGGSRYVEALTVLFGLEQVGTAQVGTAQVGAAQVGAEQVGLEHAGLDRAGPPCGEREHVGLDRVEREQQEVRL